MNSNLGSLDRLRDIVEPPPVSWWPPAPGWWILAALLLALFMVFAVRRARSWHRNRYRRRALELLACAETVTDVALLLKRTALTAYVREDVASLSGDAWCQWLEISGGHAVPDAARRALAVESYADTATEGLATLRDFARIWIAQHRVPAEESPRC